jgi:hypothetical protein
MLEKCLDPELLYLTAQTMFRSIPDSAGPHQYNVSPEIYDLGLLIRRRLFYIGLMMGHVQSALCLWWSFSYDTAAGKAEKEMIFRCLNMSREEILPARIQTLTDAVNADVVGNISLARKKFEALEAKDFGEYELLWKKRGEYYYATDEEHALAWIWGGRDLFPAPVVVATLEQFLHYTKNEAMKVRVSLYLSCYLPNYTFRSIAEQYEKLGDRLMAREYHELGGSTGDKESQAWMVNFVEDEMRKPWLRTPALAQQLESWKKLLEK